jgi:hypothetical protein
MIDDPRAGWQLITCVTATGRMSGVVRELRDRFGVATANVKTARGIGRLGQSNGGLGDDNEQQILTAIVSAEQADAVFEYLYRTIGIDQPDGGIMYAMALDRASPFVLPELPYET